MEYLEIYYTLWYSVSRWFMLYILVTQILFGLYLRLQGDYRWAIGCAPIGGYVYMSAIAGVPYILTVPVAVFTLIACFDAIGTIQMVFCILLNWGNQFLFARNYTEANPVVWAVVPFYKHVYMLKEIYKCRNTTKERNT